MGFVVLDPVLRIRKIVDDMEISLPLLWRKNSSFIPLFSTEPSFTREISDYEHFGSNLYQGGGDIWCCVPKSAVLRITKTIGEMDIYLPLMSKNCLLRLFPK